VNPLYDIYLQQTADEEVLDLRRGGAYAGTAGRQRGQVRSLYKPASSGTRPAVFSGIRFAITQPASENARERCLFVSRNCCFERSYEFFMFCERSAGHRLENWLTVTLKNGLSDKSA